MKNSQLSLVSSTLKTTVVKNLRQIWGVSSPVKTSQGSDCFCWRFVLKAGSSTCIDLCYWMFRCLFSPCEKSHGSPKEASLLHTCFGKLLLLKLGQFSNSHNHRPNPSKLCGFFERKRIFVCVFAIVTLIDNQRERGLVGIRLRLDIFVFTTKKTWNILIYIVTYVHILIWHTEKY